MEVKPFMEKKIPATIIMQQPTGIIVKVNPEKTSENVGYYSPFKRNSLLVGYGRHKMHGVKRVIAFCILTAILPATLIILPLYLRHSIFADVTYLVAESDIIEIRDGISSIFCQKHTVKMNTSFNAFQIGHTPELSIKRKHIRLKKSMSLPDDTLEYWGFYLLKGATVALKVCSRFDGSRILVVKGDRNLKTCGLLEHNKNKIGTHLAKEHDKIFVTFETVAELVDSKHTDNSYYEPPIKQHRKIVNNLNILKKDSTDPLNNAKEITFNDDDDDDINKLKQIAENYIKKHSVSRLPKSFSVKSIDITKNKLNDETDNNNIINSTKNKILNTSKADISLSSSQQQIDNANNNNTNNKIITSSEVDINLNKNIIDSTQIMQNKHKHRKRSNINSKTSNDNAYIGNKRHRRDLILDRKINHGGNAINYTEIDSTNSASSFENNLLSCYDGNILLAQSFPPSSLCTSVGFLDVGTHMVTTHEVVNDGYYYYIFYSDNDYVQNDIHAVFDIFKPTYQYSNISDTKACINNTTCTFPVHFWSDERVIVEVPTRDGIDHEEDDITMLISTCHPRMSVYIIFPITVLFLILSCAFL